MKQSLIVFYTLVLLTMIAVTTWATYAGGNVIPAGVVLWNMPWGRATFFDTYFAFTTFYLWVFYQEKSWVSRVVWFVLIMALGNIAIAGYMLRRLVRLKDKAGAKELLVRKD